MRAFSDHPALEALFDDTDRSKVAVLQELLSPEALQEWRDRKGELYNAENWRDLGRKGLFQLGLPEDGKPTGRHFARTVALLSDCLIHDARSDLDMAIYVHGLVAPYSLMLHQDRPIALDLLEKARAGRIVMCTAYTDADPAAPVTGHRIPGGYLLQGRKWLSVNMPAADFAVITFDDGDDRPAAVIDLKSNAVRRHTLTQLADDSLYLQGEMSLDNLFVPDTHVLSSGLRRLRIWNRVMSSSRLLNAISACRSLFHLIDVVKSDLADRLVAGAPFHEQPSFQRWTVRARARAEQLYATIVATLANMANNRIDEAGIGGLKALAVRHALDLAEEARVMAGGAGTLANCEITRIATSLAYHRFSGGAEAQLLALYGTSLNRRLGKKGIAA